MPTQADRKEPARGEEHYKAEAMLRYTYKELTTFSLVMLLMMWAFYLLDSVHSDWVEGRLRSHVSEQLVQKNVILSNTLTSKISLLYGLRTFVEMDPSPARLDAEFDYLATSLRGNSAGVRALQLVKNGVIQYMHPMEGNESALGLNLLDDPRSTVNESIRHALKSDRVTLNGPLELKQGGLGIVARLPVRCKDATWGLAAVVIDLPELFAEAGIASHRGELLLAARDANGNVFFGSEDVFSKSPEIQRIPLIDGYWEVAAAPATGWLELVSDQVISFRVACIIVLLLLFTLFFVSTRSKYILQKLVERRTNELQTLNLELKHEIDARRRTEIDLVTARDKAEHSERLKDAFLASMSHEIRTPLHVILGYVDLLRAPDEEILHDKVTYISSMKTAGNRLMRTVEELLHISSLRAGTFKPKRSDFDIVSTTKALVRNYHAEATDRGLELVFRSNLVRAQLHADRYSIEQSITNLIDNAIKYTEKGVVEVSIDGTDSHCSISVRDSGIGISEEYIRNVFDVFSQEICGYNRPYDGLGLGLALTKRYVELHGGKIHVESVKGKGSEFTLQLPTISTIAHTVPEVEKADMRSVVDAPSLRLIKNTARVA
jgi:signal transduction histidine kinase